MQNQSVRTVGSFSSAMWCWNHQSNADLYFPQQPDHNYQSYHHHLYLSISHLRAEWVMHSFALRNSTSSKLPVHTSFYRNSYRMWLPSLREFHPNCDKAHRLYMQLTHRVHNLPDYRRPKSSHMCHQIIAFHCIFERHPVDCELSHYPATKLFCFYWTICFHPNPNSNLWFLGFFPTVLFPHHYYEIFRYCS